MEIVICNLTKRQAEQAIKVLNDYIHRCEQNSGNTSDTMLILHYREEISETRTLLNQILTAYKNPIKTS